MCPGQLNLVETIPLQVKQELMSSNLMGHLCQKHLAIAFLVGTLHLGSLLQYNKPSA